MFYFYVLYSLKDHQLYKGYTSEIAQRLEVFDNRTDAMQREKEAKQAQAAVQIKRMLQDRGILNEQFKIDIANLA